MGHDDLLSRFDITFAPDPSRKESLVKASATILTLVAAMACGGGGQTSHTVLVAPRLNLLPYGSVGLVTFSIEKAKGTLNEFATRRFEEYLLAAQSGIEVQEFSQADSTQALSGARGVPVVFLGHLKLSDVKPSGGLIGLTLPHVEATVTATLAVELRSTKTGGTPWGGRSGAPGKGGPLPAAGGGAPVPAPHPHDPGGAPLKTPGGQLAIVDGVPEFAAQNPNDAYGHLINRLVYDVTYDLRSTWVKQ